MQHKGFRDITKHPNFKKTLRRAIEKELWPVIFACMIGAFMGGALSWWALGIVLLWIG